MLPPAQYLSRRRPFSLLSEPEINDLIKGMEVTLYKRGEKLFEPNEKIKKFYFVREGKIGLFCGLELKEVVEKDEIIEAGNPPFAITAEYTARALEDSVIFEFDLSDLQRILQRNPKFREFIEDLISGRFVSLLKLTRSPENTIFDKPVSSIVYKTPIVCLKEQTIKEAIELMNENDVGSVVVVDPERRPIGIVTHSDILRSIDNELPLTEPVERIMSCPVINVGSESSILDAYFKFLSHGVNHLAIVDNEKLVGVISIKNLVNNLETRGQLFNLTKEIIRSQDLGELRRIAHQTNSLINGALKYGFTYPSMSQLVSTIVENIIRKALSLTQADSRFTIMLVGSLGRKEFIPPLTIRLFVIGKRRDRETMPDYVKILSEVGLQIGGVDLCSDDLHNFLNSIPLKKLLEIMDARYIFGNPVAYIKFKNILKEIVQQKTLLASLKNHIEESAGQLEALLEAISNGIKVVGYIYGDTISRPTWERLKILEARGAITKDMSDKLTEAYVTLRTIEANAKFGTKEELLDEIVYKRIMKTITEFKLWISTIRL